MPKPPDHRDRESGTHPRTLFMMLVAAGAIAVLPRAAHALAFSAGDLVLSVYGDGDGSGTYTDNEASPITLDEVSTAAAPAGTIAPIGQIVLPQTSSGANNPVSGEYGSSSEGTLQLSGNGQYLTIAGYGVNAATFDANPASYGGGTKSCITAGSSSVTCFPLGQTSSVPGYAASAASGAASTITVPRVVALIGANGSVDTSTALTNVFNENNPRSVATQDGTSFYISGQGATKTDTATQGLFFALKGSSSATQIYGTVDTRTVSIQNNQLYLSSDSTEGSGVTENISSVGSAGSLPTTATTPAILPNIKSKFAVTSVSQLNGYDQNNIGSNPAFTTASKTMNQVYLSPESYFFANATTLYVADSGNPKGDNNGAGSTAQGLSDGGLQKWSLVNGVWDLDYTLSTGLDLVPDTTACTSNEVNCGSTGLIGLAGEVLGNTVELFATNSTLGDLDQTYLYGIDDSLSATTLPANEDFTVLETAAPDTDIRGVSFAPVPEPTSIALLLTGLVGGIAARRRKRQ